MLSDAVTSVKAYLYERAVSPLLGSLIISWCVWNYKFLLLLISKLDFSEKLRLINVLYSNDYEIYLQGIAFPFVTSMVYLFVFPYPSELVYKFSLRRQKILNDMKNELQENELLTLEQSKAIRNQLADVERQFDEQVERKDRVISARDREIEELRAQIEAINSGIANEKFQRDVDSVLGVTSSEEPKEATNKNASEAPLKEGLSKYFYTQSEVDNPSYLRFFNTLGLEKKQWTEQILSLLIDGSMTLSDLNSNMTYRAYNSETKNELKKLMGKFKLYDIVDLFMDDKSEYYVLTASGKELYKYIIEHEGIPVAT